MLLLSWWCRWAFVTLPLLSFYYTQLKWNQDSRKVLKTEMRPGGNNEQNVFCDLITMKKKKFLNWSRRFIEICHIHIKGKEARSFYHPEANIIAIGAKNFHSYRCLIIAYYLDPCSNMFSIIFIQTEQPTLCRCRHKGCWQQKQDDKCTNHSFRSTRNYHCHDKNFIWCLMS